MNRKGNYERTTNPHIPGSSLHTASLLVPSCHQHPSLICFGTGWGPVSSCALQTSAVNAQPAPPHEGCSLVFLSHPAHHTTFPTSPLDVAAPSRHPSMPLPGTLPPECGRRPLHAGSDLKPISVFAGLMSLGHSELQNGSSGKQMLWEGT